MDTVIKRQIEATAADIARVSEASGVLRLEIFGSAVRDRFDQGHSDLDFLVSFREGATSLDNYLRLAEGLEQLFGRPVDLVIDRAIRNPYFRQNVDSTRTLVYADGKQEAAV